MHAVIWGKKGPLFRHWRPPVILGGLAAFFNWIWSFMTSRKAPSMKRTHALF